jgi:hypothetical protein
MTQKPAKPAKRATAAEAATPAAAATPVARAAAAKPAKSGKPATPAERPATSRAPRTSRRKPSHDEISERAYFIDREEGGSDQVANWLRAERELATAEDSRRADL